MSFPTSATGVPSQRRRRHHRPLDGSHRPIRLEWLDVFETGNAAIDAIHRRLIHDSNRLLMLLDTEASWPLVVDEAGRFLERCIEHFRAEEALLECTKFPRYAEHVAEHRRMEYEMQAFIKGMERVDGSLDEPRDLPRSLGPELIELMIRHDLDYRSICFTSKAAKAICKWWPVGGSTERQTGLKPRMNSIAPTGWT